jgi:anaerobic glycerol-3-phosphate dehydrogenase
MPKNTSVIVRGGLNGLSATLVIARKGVRCVLVKRHTGTSIQCSCRGFRGT